MLAAGAAACSVAVPERTGTTRQAIVNGTESDASQDSVVLLVRYDPSLPGGMAADCSGTLLSPRIVLTARHCVSMTDESAACNEEGKADLGGKVLADFKPRSVFVFSGTKRPDILEGTGGAVRASEILTNGAQSICDNDIAVVVLEQPIANAKISPVRLEGTATKGEKVTLVGWGVTENGPQPDTRKQRAGVEIEEVGPAPSLGPKEIRIGEGSCSGDSGGPIFSEGSGALVGVLSRGGNGIDTVVPAACLGAINVYTSSGAHAALVRSAFEKTGEKPWLEGEPDPTKPAPEDEGGCSVGSRGGGRGEMLLGVAIAVVALGRRRRRRR